MLSVPFISATLAGLFVAALVWVQTAEAHSLGASLEATSTPFVIDVGYDPIEFIAGFNSRFDIELRDMDRVIVGYDSVWVRITEGKRTELATGIARQPLGPTTLLYTFKTPGEYTLHVSYRRGNDSVAEAAFPITVGADTSERAIPWGIILGLIGGVCIGAATVFVLHWHSGNTLWTGRERPPSRNV